MLPGELLQIRPATDALVFRSEILSHEGIIIVQFKLQKETSDGGGTVTILSKQADEFSSQERQDVWPEVSSMNGC